jgi:Ca2+-binding RTX toxin-like protein
VNFSTSKSTACTESVLSPGVYAVGSTLYVVGSNSNDYAMISPIAGRLDGSTGLAVVAMLNGAPVTKAFNQSFTAIDIFGYGGNDNFLLFPTLTLPTTVVEGNGNNYIQLAGGNDTVALGSGSNQVFGGNGNKTITASDIAGARGYFTLGNGNDIVQLGDGSDVVVEGNGNDYVSAGNGSDLIVAGLGQHTIQLGNGNDILIDGSATVVNFGDSLRQILSDWNANPLTSVNKRLKVVNNTSHPNFLKAGSAQDWWFYIYSKDVTNQKATDRLN